MTTDYLVKKKPVGLQYDPTYGIGAGYKPPAVYDVTTAKELGYTLQEGWNLKRESDMTGANIDTLISPDKWQFKDLVSDEQGNLKDYKAISPEGYEYPSSVLNEAQANPETLKTQGRTPATDVLLKYLYPESTPQDVEDFWKTQLAADVTLSGKEIKFDETPSGTPSLETYRTAYFKNQGWTDYGRTMGPGSPDYSQFVEDLNRQGVKVTSELLNTINQHEQEVEKAYEDKYGFNARAQSNISGATSLVLPAFSKWINPEKQKINWQDVVWDAVTIGSLGLGSVPTGLARTALGFLTNTAAGVVLLDNAVKDPNPINVIFSGLALVGMGTEANSLAKQLKPYVAKAGQGYFEGAVKGWDTGVTPKAKTQARTFADEQWAENYRRRQVPGEPEAGIQSDIFGGGTEVHPVGKGKVVQESMDEFLEYRQSLENKPKLTVKEQDILQAIRDTDIQIEKYTSSAKSIDELKSNITGDIGELQNELMARSTPFHGGAKSLFKGETTEVLNARLKTLETFNDTLPNVEITLTIPEVITEKGITIGDKLDAVSLRKINGKYQVTPSYNQQTQGLKRQLFDTEQEALNFAKQIPEVKPEVKPEIPKVETPAPKIEPQASVKETVESLLSEGKPVPKDMLDEYIKLASTPEIKTLGGGTIPPVKKPPIPPSNSIPPAASQPILPSALSENVIGLRPIQPGLVRSEVISNQVKGIFSPILEKVGAKPMVKAEPIANAAMRERARVRVAIESNANVLGTESEVAVNRAFVLDKQGRIPSLADIDKTVPGAPTIADVSARYPVYESALSGEQKAVLAKIKSQVQPYYDLLTETGIDIPKRADVMDGGFYLPRGKAALEGADEPFKLGGGRGGMRKGFERPATFASQAEGIEKGYEYAKLGESLTAYAFDAGTRATDAHVVNYFKTLTDETGQLIGETVKMRMLRQNPELVKKIDELNILLNKYKSNIGSLTRRQQDIIELWQHDPEFTDIDTLLDGLATMTAGKEGLVRSELLQLKELVENELKAIRPEYKLALRKAQVTPREQSIINLPALQGVTFPNEVANAANVILNKQGRTIGALSPVLNTINAYNNLYRGLRATLDNSALGIQGLLGMYGSPRAYAKALSVNARAWLNHGDEILGKFLNDFDLRAGKTGRLSSSEWSKYELHLGGATSEFQLGGVGSKIGNLPVVRQANRAFGYTGDALRLTWADNELATQLSKRTLAQIKASGDLERIANAANNMTGWARGKTFGSLGDIALFSSRWLQSRLETVVKAGMGLRPGAKLDQRMARNALLKMIGFGTVLTVGVNEALGNETDFRPIVDGKRNARFMRIKYGDNYYSLFGPWDSLLGMFINVGTGKPLQAIRNMGSGLTTAAFDLITGKDYDFKSTRDTPLQFAQWIMGQAVPFSAGQLPDSFKQMIGGVSEGEPETAISGGISAIAQIVGIKTTSFVNEKITDNIKRLGLPLPEDEIKLADGTMLSTEAEYYMMGNLYSDTLQKLGNYNPDEVIKNQDYPPIVGRIVETKRYIDDTLSKLNNCKLTSSSADPAKMTQRQVVAWKKYNALSNAGKENFTETNHDDWVILNVNPHDEELINNPQQNALLVIMGKEKVLTEEAYNEAIKLLEKYDIPDTAVKDYLPPKEIVKQYFSVPESRRDEIIGMPVNVANQFVAYCDAYYSGQKGAVTAANKIRSVSPELEQWMIDNGYWKPK